MSKSAFVFPGQGSQYSGMGKELASLYPVAAQVFEEADDTLGFNLSSLCFSGSEDDLKLTANTQPAILTTSIAILRVIQQEYDLQPVFLAGHSLGEYSALVCSGVMAFADAVATVRARGTFMQEAVPVGTGAMAAMLSIDPDTLVDICSEAAQGEVVSPANFNSPGQIVIAGHTGAVQRAMEIAKGRGFRKTMLLPVSAPFHCALMQPAANRLAATLAPITLNPMLTPVLANADAAPNQSPERVKPLLVTQVCAPVLWEQSVQAMVTAGVTTCIEIGPGKVLTGLIKRITKECNLVNVEDQAGLASLEQLA